ncbi:RNA methyltransferase [bacterium]|jgi:tRNA (guanosine-2'-O-)-methyltransferase|nr:RNA methyltransferase [bacterium]MBT3794891.1 RNA methyltransferase [bacterium]MBT4634794.1 RNA methyltransferase [bacterium]
MKKISIQQLAPLLTSGRKKRIDEVLSKRTKGICVLLEDIYQGHNISAVLRTCDNLGIQNIYIIQDSNKITLSKGISLGSEKWVTMEIKTKNLSKKEYIKSLKKLGFKIIATVPPSKNKSISLEKFKIKKKMIVAFGNEEKGLSKDILEESDSLISISMDGFNESYNISVSCAIVMNQLISEAKKSNKLTYLSNNERKKLRFDWYLKSLKNSSKVIKNLAKSK